MQIGLVGLKNSGKSTLFDVLTGHRTTLGYQDGVEERQGVLEVPDERLNAIQSILNTKKLVNPSMMISDLPPLQTEKQSVKSDITQIIEKIKYCDALIQVVRQFSNPAVPFEGDCPDPVREKNTLDAEMILLDLAIIENRLERIEKMKSKIKDFYQPGEPELLEKCKEFLEEEKPLTALDLDDSGEKMLRGFQFLTIKPRITIINMDESELNNRLTWIQRFENNYPAQKGTFEAISGLTEVELLDLTENERNEFRNELNIELPAQVTLTKLLMKTMQLIRFLTASEKIAQSWIVEHGVAANKAGGTIHTDMDRGFIRGEVVTFDDFMHYGGFVKSKENGCLRLEGKDYIVQDGDIIHFRFNV